MNYPCLGGSHAVYLWCRKVVEDFFGKAPPNGVNPDEVVAIGAAYSRRGAF